MSFCVMRSSPLSSFFSSVLCQPSLCMSRDGERDDKPGHVVDGHLSDLAAAIVEKTRSYTEISPSGGGIRIIGKAEGFSYDRDRYYVAGSTGKPCFRLLLRYEE